MFSLEQSYYAVAEGGLDFVPVILWYGCVFDPRVVHIHESHIQADFTNICLHCGLEHLPTKLAVGLFSRSDATATTCSFSQVLFTQISDL